MLPSCFSIRSLEKHGPEQPIGEARLERDGSVDKIVLGDKTHMSSEGVLSMLLIALS